MALAESVRGLMQDEEEVEVVVVAAAPVGGSLRSTDLGPGVEWAGRRWWAGPAYQKATKRSARQG